MWLSRKKPGTDIALRKPAAGQLAELVKKRAELISSFEVGDFVCDLGENDETLLKQYRGMDELYKELGEKLPSESPEERLQKYREYQKENPDYGILFRVFDHRNKNPIVGEPFPPSLFEMFFGGLFRRRLPKPEKKPDEIVINYKALKLRGEGIIMYGGTSLCSWHDLRDPGGEYIERIRKATDEEVFKNLEKRIKEYEELINDARKDPMAIDRKFQEYNHYPLNFSKDLEVRKSELKLVACVEAAKHFRLNEVYKILKDANTPEKRLASCQRYTRPGTNFFVVIDTLNAGSPRSSGPVAVHVVGYDKDRLGGNGSDYEYEISQEIEARYPNLFEESRSSIRSYSAIEIPSYALDLVTEVLEMERPPMNKFVMLQGKSTPHDEPPKGITQQFSSFLDEIKKSFSGSKEYEYMPK